MEGTMMGLVCHEGGRLELMERPAPKIQQPGDAVVRVTLSTICTSDLHIMRGAVPRAKSETILGHEFVGVVEETGSEVTSLKPGDRVAANCITFCGSAAEDLSTTAKRAVGNLAAGSTAARRNTAEFPLRSRG